MNLLLLSFILKEKGSLENVQRQDYKNKNLVNIIYIIGSRNKKQNSVSYTKYTLDSETEFC